MFKDLFKYFHLSRTEQHGFFVLLIFMLLVFIIPYLYALYLPEELDTIAIQTFESDPKVDQRERESYPAYEKDVRREDETVETNGRVLFSFDPNTLDRKGWTDLGFTKKQIDVILHYRSKGGRFYKKEDVQKIYSITAAAFARIENYIHIEPILTVQNMHATMRADPDKIVYVSSKDVHILLDINQADTTAFMKLPGIGATFAKRIVKYRESLGGFTAVAQIAEVYGLPVETYTRLKGNLRLQEEPLVTQININTVDVATLSKHPYVSYKQAVALLNYRTQHGHFMNLQDLRKVAIVDDVFLSKLAGYLTF